MDICRNYHRNVETSINAYSSTPQSVRDNQKSIILKKIEQLSGATCDEIENNLNLPHQTASARISELLRSNKIFDTGERRLTRRNKPARVFKIVEKSPEE